MWPVVGAERKKHTDGMSSPSFARGNLSMPRSLSSYAASVVLLCAFCAHKTFAGETWQRRSKILIFPLLYATTIIYRHILELSNVHCFLSFSNSRLYDQSYEPIFLRLLRNTIALYCRKVRWRSVVVLSSAVSVAWFPVHREKGRNNGDKIGYWDATFQCDFLIFGRF